MKKPTVATQILLNFFGGEMERFVAFATKPGFRGPTPERVKRRPATVEPGERRRPPEPLRSSKPPSKRDVHRARVRLRKLQFDQPPRRGCY